MKNKKKHNMARCDKQFMMNCLLHKWARSWNLGFHGSMQEYQCRLHPLVPLILINPLRWMECCVLIDHSPLLERSMWQNIYSITIRKKGLCLPQVVLQKKVTPYTIGQVIYQSNHHAWNNLMVWKKKQRESLNNV